MRRGPPRGDAPPNRRYRVTLAAIGAVALAVVAVGWLERAALAQGAPTPFAIFWYLAGTPSYVPVSATNPLPVIPTGSPSGTQNVNLIQIDGVAASVGAGAAGTGTQRNTVAQDITTIAGSAPGTAGSPSTNVVTAQGAATGTPMPVVMAPSTTAGIGITPVVSASLESSHVIDAGAGNLYSLTASDLTGGVSGNMLVLNATSAPADGAVTPIFCVPFDSTGKAQAVFSGIPPAVFSTGITVVASSAVSCFTKTTGVITAFFNGMAK